MEIKDVASTQFAQNPVIGRMLEFNHEQIVFCNDNDSGLKAIIAVHNTVL
ncbi:MAG: leucine dehydrogenase, partial [Bacteroidia bacterium]